MAWQALGDRAWLFEATGGDAGGRLAKVLGMARRIHEARIAGVRDVVSSFESLAVHFEHPGEGGRVREALEDLADEAGEWPVGRRAVLRVPVAYGGENGPDLDKVAAALNMLPEEVVKLHGDARYTVAAVGFSPGFPYLTGLPAALQLPRKKSPQRVAAGAVAIAGGQAGIYPNASQGGWHVIGRTPLQLFDAGREEPALLRPGDRLRFVPGAVFAPKHVPPKPAAASDATFEVLDAGLQTSVQDLGRPGLQKAGVSPGGACDPQAAATANRLVGNPPDAAVLECCMQGPVLRMLYAARVAWVGWADTESGRPHELPAGAEIDLRRRMTSLRGYFAIAGGIDVPNVLGSRATDLRAGLGGWHGRCLREGDRLPAGTSHPGPAPGDWRVGWPLAMRTTNMMEIRFVRGVQWDWFGEDARQIFQSAPYQISSMIDRTGARLHGPALSLHEHREMLSQPVVAGSVQIPPDGQPIVLMSERQTIGGYPQIGHVISADLARLARMWPGNRLRFRQVTLDEARSAWHEEFREMAMLEAGLVLRRS